MSLYELYFPELDSIVKFKILSPEEGQIFNLDHDDASPGSSDNYKKQVLEYIVFNLKTDIAARLRELSQVEGEALLDVLYNAAIMLNPGMDFALWLDMTKNQTKTASLATMQKNVKEKRTTRRPASQKDRITRAKFLNLEQHLKDVVVGQDDAIQEVVSSLRRSQVGLNDLTRPLAVFLFAGASGVGKTHLARELHKYMYGDKTDIVRIDMGEYQQKHENQKLIGSPPGYIAHDEGGQLTNQMLSNPHTVVLLDEVEKAHPDIMNTFLRVFDEGILTDGQGREVSFRNSVIIMTTNLGNDKIASGMVSEGVGFGNKLYKSIEDSKLPSRDTIIRQTEKEIRKFFKPEFLNRLDNTVIFNHLTAGNYQKIAEMELQLIQGKIEDRGYAIAWDQDVIDQMLNMGVNPIEGARKLSRIRRTHIEDPLADNLLMKTHPKGTIFQIVPGVEKFKIITISPRKEPKMIEEAHGNT